MREINSLDIQQMILAPGDIFWLRSGGKKIKIARSGQVIDSKIIDKFTGKDFSFELDEYFSLPTSVRETLVSDFNKLKLEKLEMNRVALVKKILGTVFVEYHGQVAFVDFMFIGLESFYNLDTSVTEELANIDVRLFQRSAIFATYAVLLAMSVGYLDYFFLQDIYHVCFFFDCNFSLEQVSYFVLEALEKERQEGQGKSFLQAKGKKLDLETFYNHPEESFRLAKKKFKKFINNKEIFQLIRLHHEKIDGSGFGRKLNDEDFTDIERLLIFINESLPFVDVELSADKGKNFLNENLEQGKGKAFLSPRIAKIIEESLTLLAQTSELKYE